ncbi:hypothetical protein [Streptococcus catagoni]|uniref:hypothetical protein n=1 Tax=Streptococcus catagoni TaxID=2654874 RepID=UPI00140B15FB|nr:hypothetical protein [Streptococcus catagoni]
MRRRHRILYLAGIILVCQLSLSACHSQSKVKKSSDQKQHQSSKKTKAKKAKKQVWQE